MDGSQTRYLVKYRRKDKQFVLKVTNNSKVEVTGRCELPTSLMFWQCLKYTGNFQHEVKRLDKFNHSMMQLMLGISSDSKHKATEA